ncbi:MAG: hypothetical protein HZA49_06580 [Planctomycetes bacterium]|nr:hypothetical protein [Planctomycetota bacterium]
MPQHDFIPKSDPGMAAFLRNLANKIGGYAATFNLTPAEVASAKNDAARFTYILKVQEAYKTFKQAISGYKDMLRDGPGDAPVGDLVFPTMPAAPALVNSGIFPRIRKLVGRIKATPGYTEAIGEDLGLVADEEAIDILNLKPVLKSRLDGGRPVIIWTKGAAGFLVIYVDRKDGKGFVYLTTDMYPDYMDKFPVPDGKDAVVWDYKAIYKIGDEQVGQFSEPISVTVTRQPGG